MLRSLPRLSSIALGLLAPAALAFAQQTAPQPAPSQAPPKLERIEPGSDVPATTIPERERTRIKEKKVGGQVVEVEVQAGPSHYYLKPNNPAGSAQPGTQEAGAPRGPQWKVLEFDIGARKKGEAVSNEAGVAPPAAEAPPPPRPATK